jgi:hypothetical protein
MCSRTRFSEPRCWRRVEVGTFRSVWVSLKRRPWSCRSVRAVCPWTEQGCTLGSDSSLPPSQTVSLTISVVITSSAFSVCKVTIFHEVLLSVLRTLVAHIRATRPVHRSLLDFAVLAVLGDLYKSRSFLTCIHEIRHAWVDIFPRAFCS